MCDPSKVAHLKALEGAKERLRLFQANLTKEGSFDAAIDGCDGVFHTASPVILDNYNDPQTELIEPAVKGTLNILSSCVKASSSIKRVVLTSSMASIMVNRNLHINAAIDETWFSDPAFCEEAKTELIEPAVKGTLNVLSSCVKASSSIKRVVLTSSMASMMVNRNLHINAAIDETWFSDPAFCEEAKQGYVLSKTLAEEAALKFAEENGMDLVVINPGLVIGPLLQPTLNATSDSFVTFIREGMTYSTDWGRPRLESGRRSRLLCRATAISPRDARRHVAARRGSGDVLPPMEAVNPIWITALLILQDRPLLAFALELYNIDTLDSKTQIFFMTLVPRR
ncbi:UNVERIFIED_CONTAM: Tetraketide alpha-pyrone reductase 1 [Sesamum radiatum]|uniref:Tetraketide alpha-pyrone reductase 1 n=1 Tax=Sesamum radiatum TaxID=300843 RepID=A0AAW2U914_SESRA